MRQKTVLVVFSRAAEDRVPGDLAIQLVDKPGFHLQSRIFHLWQDAVTVYPVPLVFHLKVTSKIVSTLVFGELVTSCKNRFQETRRPT